MNCRKALSQPQEDWARRSFSLSTKTKTKNQKNEKKVWVEGFNVQKDLSTSSAFAVPTPLFLLSPRGKRRLHLPVGQSNLAPQSLHIMFVFVLTRRTLRRLH